MECPGCHKNFEMCQYSSLENSVSYDNCVMKVRRLNRDYLNPYSRRVCGFAVARATSRPVTLLLSEPMHVEASGCALSREGLS